MSSKLNIAIDIDDTLTDTATYLQPYIAEYFGAELSEVREKGISYEKLPEPWKKDTIAFMKAYFDRVIPYTPFKPDAAWGVNTLRAAGHRIVIIPATVRRSRRRALRSLTCSAGRIRIRRCPIRVLRTGRKRLKLSYGFNRRRTEERQKEKTDEAVSDLPQ